MSPASPVSPLVVRLHFLKAILLKRNTDFVFPFLTANVPVVFLEQNIQNEESKFIVFKKKQMASAKLRMYCVSVPAHSRASRQISNLFVNVLSVL